MERWRRECPHVVRVSVSVPKHYQVFDLVNVVNQFTQWLDQHGVLAGDFMVDRSDASAPGVMSWTYRFRNPDMAMLFKLTFGGT